MSLYFGNRILRNMALLMSPDEPNAGGGGKAPPPETKTQNDDLSKIVTELQASNKALLDRLAKLEGSKSPPPEDEGDLREKARKQREDEERKTGDTKQLESALKFQLKADDWIKNNSALLPKDVPDIFKAAERENFSSAIEKDQAIKAGIIQSFFAVQSNVDLLTPGLKTALDEWSKLTKNVKQERAQQIYDAVFEPTFEMLRREKKAEALRKGHGVNSGDDDAYKAKLMGLSRKHYLGEKQNGT